ncbi:unnamed protein product [Rotaria sp. Silwood2]|nr:unnamed protein product [Rotaria sp. Silwood2]
MVEEWHASQTLSSCLSNWFLSTRRDSRTAHSFLYTLCFNVRGLDARWAEVYLLSTKHQFDILVLGEVGKVDLSLIGATYPSYHCFYQAGENAFGGVIVLIRQNIPASRLLCSLPNVCIIDLHLEVPTRLIGIYAPASKSLVWNDLSRFTTPSFIIMGDFNVDLEKDGDKADTLLNWADDLDMAPFVPDAHTSLRSDRTIDYALGIGIENRFRHMKGPQRVIINRFSLLAHSRTIALKAKRTGSVRLREEARRIRNIARYELKRFRQEQLTKQLADRHKSGKESNLFWSRTKRHFRKASASLRGLISPDGESSKDPQRIANLTADYYEQLFKEPTVMRPHPFLYDLANFSQVKCRS